MRNYYCPTIRLLFKISKMASNSGTSLIYGNGKRNQLYRASNAVYQPEKHGVSETIVQKYSGVISSVPLTSTIINQQPAMISTSAIQVRRKFESTTRWRQFAMNHARDTIAMHLYDFPTNNDSQRQMSTNRWKLTVSANAVDCFLDQSLDQS